MHRTEERMSPAARIGEPMDWAPRLAEILDGQRDICQALETLSGEQKELIRNGDASALMRVLGRRQELIDQLSRLNAELEPYRREWEWCMGRLGAAEREQMEGAVRELSGLVDRITASDEADRVELEQQRSAVSAEITGVSRGRVAMTAYGVKGLGRGPMFQDRSC